MDNVNSEGGTATEPARRLIRVRATSYGEVVDTDGPTSTVTMRPAAPDPTLSRRAQPADFLLPVARRWMTSLPSSVRPKALAERFPRLANRFATAWHDEPSVDLVFSDLMIDHRGNRQGFPPAVKADLHRLWRHWQREREASRRGVLDPAA
ncbi:MAG: hypothetical protein U1F48_18490 [Burkholderiales bacterium]